MGTPGPMTRVVLTDDDGVHSPGLHALARYLVEERYDVCIVAPDRDCSGSSASIGQIALDDRVMSTHLRIPGLPEIEAHAVPGPAGMAAMATCLGTFGPVPDVVVSGINAGANTGHLVLHSGTVGAALTAQNFGVSGLAVSLERSDPWFWSTACDIAGELLAWLVHVAPERSVVSLNVPPRPFRDVLGVRSATWTQPARCR